MTDPWTGEGLFFVAKSAELAVEAIKKAFEKKRFHSRRALHLLETTRKRRIHDRKPSESKLWLR
ncbi:MAG: hypothetical protein DRN04_05370 [Thermoprotei archaeon]|nr:MAG: hypothetical protein DRN04_05370 [Thermoprotei archaeon]